VRLHQLQEAVDDVRVEGFVQPCRTEQVPGVHHQVDQPEPQERLGRDVTSRTRDQLARRCVGEGLSLLSC
jgi:hypothetical protein